MRGFEEARKGGGDCGGGLLKRVGGEGLRLKK